MSFLKRQRDVAQAAYREIECPLAVYLGFEWERCVDSTSTPTPQEDSHLTIIAFCTYWSYEDFGREECAHRSSNLATAHDRWRLWAEGVVDYDDVFYRFNGGTRFFQAGMGNALAALGTGCHEVQIAEADISTHWSTPYEFCFTTPTALPTSSPPSATPTP